VRPTVYQGMYNVLTRAVETELLPCLRALKIRFYAFNPVAGGLLTNKHAMHATKPTSYPPTGRFSSSYRKHQQYRDRYWTTLHFEAVNMIAKACSQTGVSVQAAAHRWLVHHSKLRSACHDAVIIGCTTVDMLKENMSDIKRGGPLPVVVVVAMEQAWLHCKEACVPYYRPFNAASHGKGER
jgi:aflatoxin B1 aldehyde reductase